MDKDSKKTRDHTKTMDEKHSDMMNIFYVIENETIPKLLDEKQTIHSALKQMKMYSDEYHELKEKLEDIKAELKSLKRQKKDYLLQNSKYIFNYYEEKQKISSGENNIDSNTINMFFKIKGTTNESSDINNDKYKSSKQIYQQYWKNVDGDIIHLQEYVIDSDNCLLCNQGELIPLEEEGVLICNNVNCGKFMIHIVDNQKPLNKEMPNEVSYTAYIRLNHFKEILSQFQAKETTRIPDDVLDAVKNRIKKERKKMSEMN